MKHFVLGAALAGGLIVSSTALASTLKGIQLVTNIQVGNQVVAKFVDKDTDVVCYTYTIGNTPGGISCLK